MRLRLVASALVGLALLGAGVRLLPLLGHAVWGSDTGEYHRIAAGLLAEGRLALDYDGWGIAYPWFPGLYSAASGLSAMTGLGLRATLEVLVPALAGLAALLVALLAYRVFRRPEPALLAGAALAVVMPHAFATSHTMPGALGHLFGLAAILLLWRAEEDRTMWPALLLALLAVVATHHLSTYMLLLALGGMVGVRALLVARRDRERHRAGLAALAFTLAAALAWWAWARPIKDLVVPSAGPLGLAALGAAAFAGVALLAALPRLRARWARRYRPGYPSAARSLRIVLVMFATILAGSALVALVRVPGTTVSIQPGALLWFVPFLALLGFGFLGSQLAKFRPDGAHLYGWALGLLGSFAAMMALNSTVLLPYRHVEYIMEPAAVMAGGGLAAVLALAGRRGFARPAAVGVVALLAVNAALAYPPPAVLAGFQEGTTQAEMEAVMWARDHVVLAPDAVIAGDHRTSSMLFGFAGLDATWEYAPLTFRAASFEEARPEMEAVHAPSGVKRVDFVFLSAAMREGLALRQWEPAQPLGAEAQAKFERDAHYDAVCQSAEVVVYEVVWAPPATGPRAAPPCSP